MSSLLLRLLFFMKRIFQRNLKGVYLTYWSRQNNISENIHGSIEDPDYLRCVVDGMAPVVWWGDIKQIGNSLVAGVYPAYYMNKEEKVLRSAFSFYKSDDKGYHWKIIGKIPYQPVGGQIMIVIFLMEVMDLQSLHLRF